MQRNEARPTALWRKSYSRLVATRPDGWFASATARAQAQAVRLSIAYAVLDNSAVITGEHLAAALAMWDYAEASARVLFAEVGYEGRQTDTEKVRAYLAEHLEVTRSELSEKVFSKHRTAREMDGILYPLIGAGEVIQKVVETSGRTQNDILPEG